MIGDELFNHMQADKVGIILESEDDAYRLSETLIQTVDCVAMAAEIPTWFRDRSAKAIVAGYDGRRVLFSRGTDLQALQDYCETLIPFSQLHIQPFPVISTIDDLI